MVLKVYLSEQPTEKPPLEWDQEVTVLGLFTCFDCHLRRKDQMGPCGLALGQRDTFGGNKDNWVNPS